MDRVRKQIGLTSSERGGKGICIAVLDTGVAAHPDIKHKIKYFKDFVGNSSLPYDDSSHGTHICGILCGDGKKSQGKYCGIAPEAHLVVCKILNQKGEGRADTMLEALEFLKRYRKQLDIRIVNISVGIGELSDSSMLHRMHCAIEELWDMGVIVVCAAGNKGPSDDSISSVCNSTKVITVGCHDGEYFKEEKEKELECFNGFVDTLTLLIRKYGNRVLNK